jgi:acyl-CoA thioesterase
MPFDAALVAELLSRDAYATSLGIEVIDVKPDEMLVAMDVKDEHTNFLSLGHGGMVFSLADCALSLASNSQFETALAVDAHIALTAPSRAGDRLSARIVEVSASKRLATYQVEVTRRDGRTVAAFTGTVHIATD